MSVAFYIIKISLITLNKVIIHIYDDLAHILFFIFLFKNAWSKNLA